jgi:hypothetical protein
MPICSAPAVLARPQVRLVVKQRVTKDAGEL